MNDEERVIAALYALMGKRESLQGKGLAIRVVKKTGIDPIAVQQALGKLARQGIIKGVLENGLAVGLVSFTAKAPAKPVPESLIRWREAMHNCGFTKGDMAALASCHDRLDGFADSDLQGLAHGLSAMRQGQAEAEGIPRFVLSAKYLLGSSKLLGSLPSPALRRFGIDVDSFPDAIPQIIVAGPESPEAVLLIENPHAFEEAIAAGCDGRLALVMTFGYGLSRSGEAYGNSLINLMAQADRLVPLVRSGNPPSPRLLLGHPKIFFWGDLDKEGLRIYASLRKRIPTLRASALYLPMVEAMRRGHSHPYTKATAKENQGTADTLPDDVAWLVPFCIDHGVDQEVVGRAQIAALAAFSIEDKTR